MSEPLRPLARDTRQLGAPVTGKEPPTICLGPVHAVDQSGQTEPIRLPPTPEDRCRLHQMPQQRVAAMPPLVRALSAQKLNYAVGNGTASERHDAVIGLLKSICVEIDPPLGHRSDTDTCTTSNQQLPRARAARRQAHPSIEATVQTRTPRAPARASALRLAPGIAQLGLFAPILSGGGMTGWASL